MSAYEQCKAAGLENGLVTMSEICGVTVRTLHYWHLHTPEKFNAMLAGVVAIKEKTK